MTTTTIKVGVLPGAINEFAVEVGTTVAEVLTLAGLNAEGYDVRLDGNTVDMNTTIQENSNVLVLVKKIKGNMNTVKVGMLPGAISEYVVEDGATVAEVLELAGLNSEGYDIRLDGNNVRLTDVVNGSVLVLVKKIKGNMNTIKVGMLPGAISEYAIEEDATVAQVLELAGLNPDGYDIRLDGNDVSLDSTANGSVLVLVKKIKGNLICPRCGEEMDGWDDFKCPRCGYTC